MIFHPFHGPLRNLMDDEIIGEADSGHIFLLYAQVV